ncbi:ACP S-malonyltransferase [Ectothiorhodospiraceae bacterium WFHF3C12]|nr:ACP S-malonyltransferase [Ectothiorhodospiraceae bacterium WFHF3C12]
MTQKLAFVFPGQGSQSVGMLGDLAEAHGIVRDTFAEASEALGYDLWDVVQNGPEATLNRTDCTQPAMLAAGVAVWRVWTERGGEVPTLMAGHSLGEYTALACAQSIRFSEAVAVVADRGRYMQEAVPEGSGAMAAILGLDDEVVERVCREAAEGEVVEAVNFNAPGQVVIAGSRSAVERAVKAAEGAGAKRAMELPVSVPSHCALMKPAAERLAERLAGIEVFPPRIPVIHNVDVSTSADSAEIREKLVAQLHSPVRWVGTVQRMAKEGVDRAVECGPGRVLAGLNRRIDRQVATAAVHDPQSLEKALEKG